MKNMIAVCGAVLLTSVVGSNPARAATVIDVLSDVSHTYNLYLSGNMGSAGSPISWTDTEGKVAVGGDAYLRGYATAQNDPGGVALAVGGNLNYQSGTIYGNVVTGGNATFPTNNGGTTVVGKVSTGGTLGVAPTSYQGTASYQGLPLDFAATSQALQSASTYLASAKATAQGATGTVANTYGSLTLSGSGTGLVFFNLSANDLVGIHGLNFQVDPNATVVLNISGQMNGIMGSYGISGNQSSRTLFNFLDATSIQMSSIGLQGSLLAPKATIDANNGQLNGSIIAKDWIGGAQINRVAFAGALPAAVPEPATWAMMVLGVGLIGAALRRRGAAVPKPA